MTQSNPDVEIVGESVLYQASKRELFEFGKEWVLKHWQKENRPVTKIQLEGKVIGRNIGFIMNVSISNPCTIVRYFAKVQGADMDTVMIHYLLKYTNSGPDVFMIVPLKSHYRDGRYGEGVITMEVPNFKMASAITAIERSVLRAKPTFLKTQFFLVTLLAELGHFSAIPFNRDNWGYASDATASPTCTEDLLQRLVLVDFSSAYERYKLDRKREFQFKLLENYNDYSACYSFEHIDLKKQARQFTWLRSKEVFTALLQRVMRRTEDWLLNIAGTRADTATNACTTNSTNTSAGSDLVSIKAGAGVDSVDSVSLAPSESSTGTALPDGSGGGLTRTSSNATIGSVGGTATPPSITSTDATAATAATASTAATAATAAATSPATQLLNSQEEKSATLTVSPHMHTLRTSAPHHVRALVDEYVEWVRRWNHQCKMMFQWMPSPRRAKVTYVVQVRAVRVKSHLRRRQVTYQYRV